MATETISKRQIDDLFAAHGIGSLDKAIGLNSAGINISQSPRPIPRSKEHQGYVFFTRPQLNMQSDNLRNVREVRDLVSGNPLTEEYKVRCLLDPRLGAGYRYLNTQAPEYRTPLVDNELAFIPFLTNNCNTLTGWPEEVMTFQTSKPDVYGGVKTQPNGSILISGKYTLSGNFRNVYGDPLIKLMHYWMFYMSAVSTYGTLRPYPDMEAYDYVDSNTRIYRIILDPLKEKVSRIYACGAALPSANAISASADYNRETPYSDQTKDLNISFECDGMIIMDPILIYTFNGTVEAFCPGMREENRERAMVKLSKLTIPFFDALAYPRINPDNNDFEWWVKKETYEKRGSIIVNALSNSGIYAETEGD